jgi:hypothetical protein
LQNEANISFRFNDEVGFAMSIQATDHEGEIAELQRQLAETQEESAFKDSGLP